MIDSPTAVRHRDMTDLVTPEIEEPNNPIWPVALYVALIGAILGFGILIRTAGAEPIQQRINPDVDTVVLDRFSVEMGRFHLESNRIPVTLEQMSPILIDAILVAVDPNYLDTKKTPTWPLAVAALKGNYIAAKPSVTQLYVRLHHGVPNTRIAALREISSVVYLERTYPKEAILEEYFSAIPLGRGSYGVEAASLAWYGRKSGEVEIAQAAHLASLAAGTSDRNEILENLRASGSITSGELAAQRKISVSEFVKPFVDSSPQHQMASDVGLKTPLQQIYVALVERYGQDAVTQGRVETKSTIDLGLQTQIAEIVQEFEADTKVQDIAVVVLDDRNQLRAAYASQQSLFERNLSDIRTVDQLMGQPIEFDLVALSDEITVLRLGELHSILGRNGRSYATELILETRDQLGQTIDRFSHHILMELDDEQASRMNDQLNDFRFRGPQLVETNNEIVVKGYLGLDPQHQIAWFGGASARFTVSFWFTTQTGSLDGTEEPQSSSSLRRESERLARRIFNASHKQT